MPGVLTNDVKAQEYYRLAYACVQMKHGGTCPGKCATCTLNVHLYMNDVREATLIKTSAELDFMRSLAVAKQRKADTIFDGITTILMLLFSIACFIVLIVWPVSCVVKGVKGFVKPTMPAYELQDMADTATPEVTRKVLTTCDYVKHNTKDVNQSGDVDCIDYAITFYEQYGTAAKLIWWIIDYKKETH